MRFLQAILFDLGDTLIHARDPWAPVLERGSHALADSLRQARLPIDSTSFPRSFTDRLNNYYDARDEDLYERTTSEVLRSLLAEQGIVEVPEALIRSALDALYSVTQSNWVAEEDAAPTLRQLQDAGYRLGIVSNAGDDKDVHELAERAGIDHFFDFILTSAACSYRKPHPRIFEIALAHWQIKAEAAAMIGDRLDADISGAQKVGLLAIWIKRRVREPGAPAPRPDAVIEALDELPALLHENKF